MFNEEKRPKRQKKVTKQRLKNIALYYLERFDSSVENLRKVLERRVYKYKYENPEFDKAQADAWIEEVLKEFEGYKYLDDERYAEVKIKGYLGAGKSVKHIQAKMAEKGISESVVAKVLGEEEYDEAESALRLAKKKKIGPYRDEETRKDFWQKDMGTLVRAGFSYEIVKEVLGLEDIE